MVSGRRIGIMAKGKLVQMFVDVDFDGFWDLSAFIVIGSLESGSLSIINNLSNMGFDDFELSSDKS